MCVCILVFVFAQDEAVLATARERGSRVDGVVYGCFYGDAQFLNSGKCDGVWQAREDRKNVTLFLQIRYWRIDVGMFLLIECHIEGIDCFRCNKDTNFLIYVLFTFWKLLVGIVNCYIAAIAVVIKQASSKLRMKAYLRTRSIASAPLDGTILFVQITKYSETPAHARNRSVVFPRSEAASGRDDDKLRATALLLCEMTATARQFADLLLSRVI